MKSSHVTIVISILGLLLTITALLCKLSFDYGTVKTELSHIQSTQMSMKDDIKEVKAEVIRCTRHCVPSTFYFGGMSMTRKGERYADDAKTY